MHRHEYFGRTHEHQATRDRLASELRELREPSLTPTAPRLALNGLGCGVFIFVVFRFVAGHDTGSAIALGVFIGTVMTLTVPLIRWQKGTMVRKCRRELEGHHRVASTREALQATAGR